MRILRRFPFRVGEGRSLGLAALRGITASGDCSELVIGGWSDDSATPASSSSESDDSEIRSWRRLGASLNTIPVEIFRFFRAGAAFPPLGDSTSGEGEDDRVISESRRGRRRG